MKKALGLILLLFFSSSLYASVVIVNGLTHGHSLLSPSDKVQGIIRVRNDGDKDSRILIYRQDLVPECTAAPNYLDADSHPRSLGKDLLTNVDEKVLSGKEEYDIRYTVALDKEKQKPGTYWEVLMIEVVNPIKEETTSGIHVSSRIRYAIQIIVDAGSFDGPKLSFENVVFDKVTPKNTMLKIQLKNNGIFGARTNVVLEVYDSQGNKIKTTEPNGRMMYPGYCNTFEIPLSDLAKGKYDCVIVADTGKDLFGSNISVQIE